MEKKILTDEGLELWNNITKYEAINEAEVISIPPPPKKPRKSIYEKELDALRLEIRKIIKNSELVIEDCNNIIAACTTKEEYISCDAKVAKGLHERLITRMLRLLNGYPAFEHEVELEEEQETED